MEYAKKTNPEHIPVISSWYNQKKLSIPKTQPRKKNILKKKREYKSQARTFAWKQRPISIERKLSWPLNRKFFYVSSLFGPRSKRDGSRGFHYGLDLAALKGTPIYAASQGKIIVATHQKGYGNTIVIKHSPHLKTRYAHLHSICIQVGNVVTTGQRIGTVGATGHVRAKKGRDPSHLHFEVYVNGIRVNPLYFLV